MAMASTVTATTTPSQLQNLPISKFSVRSLSSCGYVFFRFQSTQLFLFTSSERRCVRPVINPISAAAGSGLEASVADSGGDGISLKNASVVVESQDDNKMQLRVDITGVETQIVFDKVLANLAKSAPPIPGFRRQKGGKTSNVPKSFLLDVLGEDRVTQFVIQEIVSSSVAQYAKKENLNVKDNKINTTQSAEELKLSFKPGSEFGFNAVLELQVLETESPSS
ncbi:hypothetical protein UlMin_016423 [Ulmus minor]